MGHLQVDDESCPVNYTNELDADESTATSLLDDIDPDQISLPVSTLSPSVCPWPLGS